MIWKNTNETLQENDIPVATDYDLIMTEHGGHLIAAIIGEFNEDLIEYRDLTDKHREMFNDRQTSEDALESLFRKRGIQLANLIFNDEVAYNEQPEEIVNPAYKGLGYDREINHVVVYDMGEAGASFNLQHTEIDSYDEFVETHGIREQALKILENVDEEYKDKHRLKNFRGLKKSLNNQSAPN